MKKLLAVFFFSVAFLQTASVCADQIVFQPDPVAGKDMWLSSLYNQTAVDDDKIEIGGWGDYYRGFIMFDLTGLPPLATSATMNMYTSSRSGATPVSMDVYLLTSVWSETTQNYNDPLYGYYAGTMPAPVPNSWYILNITSIYNGWKNGTYANNGFVFLPTSVNNEFNIFRSSDYMVDPLLRPKLVITYDGSNQFMDFPVSTTLFPQGAYTSGKMISVLDHNMTVLYQNDGNITSFTGEQFAATTAYPTTVWAPCYPKVGGASWSSLLQSLYVGTSGSGSSNCTAGVAINYDSHPGYDFVASNGTNVYTVSAGTVVSQNGGCVPKGIAEGCVAWGAVGVDHGDGYISQYLHLATINVTPGQVIPAGYLIGTSGKTSPANKAVGYHLHFEVLKLRSGYTNDYQVGSYATVDPYGYNTASGVQDVLANTNGVASVCLWKIGCTLQ